MLLGDLSAIGRDPATGGVDRSTWSVVDRDLREWFVARAAGLGLDVETDGNGNLWAWWNAALPGRALVIGSHLDSVPSGGEWDGPLGVAASFAAIEALSAQGFAPSRPVAVVAFAEEEGARFGVACLGSRLLVGAVTPERALALRDRDGTTLLEAMTAAGHDPRRVGPDPARLAQIGEFVELHVEQGRLPVIGGEHAGAPGLAGAGSPLGVASEIWPHGRWRLDFAGVANHAGTTALADRVDPVIALAEGVLAVRRAAAEAGVLGTVGRLQALPGAVNAIAASASIWIDARGAAESSVRDMVRSVERQLSVSAVEESWTAVTPFDRSLTAEVARAIAPVAGGEPPVLPSGAGHDAGVLALAGVPVAMVFVRNPSGISHSPEEFVEETDAQLGVAAVAAILRARA